MKNCPLCQSDSLPFADGRYFICQQCEGIFLPTEHYLTPEKEKARYETHQNDVNDMRYQNFVSPITDSILEKFSPEHIGLDFGAGTGPVISKILRDQGFNVKQYDPFFFPSPNLLDETYDYIACCEVMEHFFYPAVEFERLKKMLNPGGILFCKTSIYDESINFRKWYYRNDPTHVIIYQNKTLEWIKNKFLFSNLIIKDKHIEFWK
ncbi:MAG: class I SAM-dependent methyltransferase [Saprospiraceae bacterium]|nr:class I SAM-dependent methyltransferase [Saprospiraceae bacterium]